MNWSKLEEEFTMINGRTNDISWKEYRKIPLSIREEIIKVLKTTVEIFISSRKKKE